MTKWLPISQDLKSNPELAALSVLHCALDVACHAISAMHPHLQNSKSIFCTEEPRFSCFVAREIFNLALCLQKSISWYKQELIDELNDNCTDIPF